jgi:putative colanic acid biosynthesis acetyltransferase WcaF
MKQNLKYHKIKTRNKLIRAIWNIVWLLAYRPTPRSLHSWRRLLLRTFGAKIGMGAHPYPSARIWAPWNLEMGDHSCLSEHVDCYSVAKVVIGAGCTVSQYSFLCTASHDHALESMPLVVGPITIGRHAWITADVFIGPGVSIGDGTVVNARSTVLHDLPPWVVAAGNPAVPIRPRKFDRNSRHEEKE